MTKNQIPHILFLPSWYPNPSDEMFGLFVKNHALAAAQFCKISVVYVVFDQNIQQKYQTQIKSENNFTELVLLVKKANTANTFLNNFLNSTRLINAYRAGFKIVNDANGKVDLVHVHIVTKIALLVLWYKFFHRIPYVVSEHWSRYLPENRTKSDEAAIKFFRFVGKRAEAILPVSNYLRAALLDINIECKRFEIVPNVVDNLRFIPSLVASKSIQFRFFHISCFEDKSKNITGILHAVKKLSTLNLDFKVSFIGTGIDFDAMKELSKSLNLSEFVEFVGELKGQDLILKIQNSDCGLLFSRYETFGTVVLESYACGKPMIVSNVAALPEIALPEFSVLVENENIDELAFAMKDFMDGKLIFDQQAMVDFVNDNYSVKAVGARLSKIYTNCLK